MKKCNYCHVSKILDEFPLNKNGIHSGNCLLCKEKRKDYFNRNKNIISQKKKIYYEENKVKILKDRKSYYEENKNEVLKKNKENYQEHKEEYLKYKKKYYSLHKDHYLDLNKQDRKNNPEKHLWRAARKRAKEKNIPFDISIEDINIPDICPILKFPLEVGSMSERYNSPSLDRIIPKLGYVKNNIKVISFKANTLKRDGSIEDFEKIIEYIKKSNKKEQ